MRVIAGNLRHREIKQTNLTTTRETQDKVRQAIFTMIGPYFDGGSALDLFCGSGAMAIEAYSRGIEEIYLNDINAQALKVSQENCMNLGIKNAFFSNLDYLSFLQNNTKIFDLIILDPPYLMDQIDSIIISCHPFLSKKGILVFEMGKDSIFKEEYGSLKLIKNKLYGIKRVLVYQNGR
ncbi:MAG: RsmD family RNA methyltransferase [Anaeroplasmataceae bacterium]|nr:RsmD family RNA methyltransferase [Anaeroplasmataceae bacterium]